MNQLATACFVSLVPCVLTPPLVAQATSRVSTGLSGANANGPSAWPHISDDGRYIVYESDATNIVAGANNGIRKVYLYDSFAATTQLVSHTIAGGQPNGPSQKADISGDGTFVVFQSSGSGLVTSSYSGTQIFRWNRTTDQIEIVSTAQPASPGQPGTPASADCAWPRVSDTGQYVVFETPADNLVPGDVSGYRDVFLKDVQIGTIRRVSVDAIGVGGVGDSSQPVISGNGQVVAFLTIANLLPSQDGNGDVDVYVFDTTSFTNPTLVSAGPGIMNGTTLTCDLSGGGFESTFCKLNGSTSSYKSAYQPPASTIRVDIAPGGGLGNGVTNCRPVMSNDGRYVAYTTTSTNITQTPDAFANIVMYDSLTSQVRVVSRAAGGQMPNGDSDEAAVNVMGDRVAFASNASNLVVGDSNGVSDVFIADPFATSVLIYCAGNGAPGTTPCPCGNNSPQTALDGCLHSFGQGARLSVGGTASVSVDSLVLYGTQMTNSTCIYLQGDTVQAGGIGSVLGDGLLCVAGPLIRLGVQTNAGGGSQFPGVGQPSVSARGECTPSEFHTYQVWYRNSAAFCTPATSNLSNGAAVTWAP